MGIGAQPLAGLRVALAGPGRVGTSLAHWARAAGAAIELVAGRTAARRDAVAGALGARAVPIDALASADCDLLLVAVADPALDGVARALARHPQAEVALHTAGSRGASALAGLGGSAAGAFHPLMAFPAPLPDPAEARGVFFALDGPPPAVALGRRLADAFGGRAEVVPEADRPLYHLAASVAAGGVATLVASTADLARSLGLPDAVGDGYLTLAAGALARLRAAADEATAADRPLVPALAAAITGPVARGDDATFVRQMETLRASGAAGQGRVDLVVRLALETARLTAGEAAGTDRRRALERALEEAGLMPAGPPTDGAG